MSFLKILGFDPAKHSVRTEIVAGLTTFLTMAYILAVNPLIFGDLEGMGMPKDSVFTATALAAIMGILRLHSVPDNGIQLAVCFDRCPDRGYHLYITHCNQCP